MGSKSDRPFADIWDHSIVTSLAERTVSRTHSVVRSYLLLSFVRQAWVKCIKTARSDWISAQNGSWFFNHAVLVNSWIQSAWRAAAIQNVLRQIVSHDAFTPLILAHSARLSSVFAVIVVALLSVLVGTVSFGVGVMIAVTMIPIPILFEEYKKTNDLLSPLFLISGFFILFFYLPYLSVVVLGYRVYSFENPVYTAHLTMLFLFVGYLGYVIGYCNDTGRKFAKRLLTIFPSQPPMSPQVGSIIGVVIYAFGLVSLAVFVLHVGGVSAVLSAPQWGEIVIPENKIFWYGLNAGLFSGFALYLAARESITKRGIVVFLGSAGIFAALHSRKRIAGIILVCLLLYHYKNRKIRVLDLTLVGVTCFAIIGLYRPIEEVLIQGKNLAVMNKIEFKFEQRFVYHTLFQTHMGQINGIPGEVPYQLGRTLPNNLIPYFVRDFPIIREVYAHPSSAQRISVMVSVGLGTWENKGLVPGLFGELYINYGLVGIALGGLLMGYFSRWAYTLRPNKVDSVWVKAAYPLFMYFIIASVFKTVIYMEQLRIMSPLLVGAILRAKFYSWRG